MRVTSVIPEQTRSHSFVLRRFAASVAVLFGAVIAIVVLVSDGKTAHAALLPSISNDQLGRTELSEHALPDSSTTTLSRSAAARSTQTQIEARDVSARAELGVPEILKTEVDVNKPTNPAPRTPLPNKVTYKHILVDLSEQRVYAKEDGVTVFTSLISSGLTGPTPVGQFKIYSRIYNGCMSGPGYSLCNIHHIQYFHGDYSIHEAWWHENWGHPMSHGCVNMSYDTSKFFWNWAGYGTDVYIRN